MEQGVLLRGAHYLKIVVEADEPLFPIPVYWCFVCVFSLKSSSQTFTCNLSLIHLSFTLPQIRLPHHLTNEETSMARQSRSIWILREGATEEYLPAVRMKGDGWLDVVVQRHYLPMTESRYLLSCTLCRICPRRTNRRSIDEVDILCYPSLPFFALHGHCQRRYEG